MVIFENALTLSHIPCMYSVLSRVWHFEIVINRKRCNDTRHGRVPQYMYSVRAVLFSMRSLESLVIVMTGPCVVYSASRQMHDQSTFELTLDDILRVASIPAEPYAFYQIQPNPWPNLRRLTLHSMLTSWCSLIALLYTLRATLTSLTLNSVTASPSSSNGQASWNWLRLVYWIMVFMPNLSSIHGGRVTGQSAEERQALYKNPGFEAWALEPGEVVALLDGDIAAWLTYFRKRTCHRKDIMEPLRAKMGMSLRGEIPAPLRKQAHGFFAARAEEEIKHVLGLVRGS